MKVFVEDGKRRHIAQSPEGHRPCAARVTRNGIVSLEVGGNTHRLGTPDQRGEVVASLSDQVLADLYAEDLDQAPQARVLRRDPAGRSTVLATFELRALMNTERRLQQLLGEFRNLLAVPASELGGLQRARTYELDEQLSRYDSGDPRIEALQSLFLERLYERKAAEQSARLRQNLEALNAARELLARERTRIIVPAAVLEAVRSGQASPSALDWARGQSALALRRLPSLCDVAAGGFRFDRALAAPALSDAPESRLALEILRFAFDDPYEAELNALCRQVTG